jgi:hypothetical protein
MGGQNCALIDIKARDRVLTLLLLESAEPRAWDRSWQDGESFDSYDQFISTGQHPVR